MRLKSVGFAIVTCVLCWGSVSTFSSVVPFVLAQAPTTENRKAEAAQLVQKGLQQYQSSQPEAAIRSWEQALKIYQQTAQRPAQAKVQMALGTAYRSLSQHKKSIEYFQQALSIFQHLNDQSMESVALIEIGNAYSSLLQYDQSIAAYQQALSIYQQTKNRNGKAEALSNLGIAHNRLLQFDKAISYFQQALPIFQQLKQRNSEAKVLANLGFAYRALSQSDKAITYFQQALSLSQQLKDLKSEADILGNIGLTYAALSDYNKAILYFQQALPIFQQLKHLKNEATVLNQLGIAYDYLSQYEKEIAYFQQALFIFQQLQNREGEVDALNNLGVAYQSLFQYDKAISYFQQALPIAQQLKYRDSEANALGNLGKAYSSLGQNEKSIVYSRQALAILQQLKNRKSEATVLGNLGQAYIRLAQYNEAVMYLQQALSISQQLKDRDQEARVLSNLGMVNFSLLQYDKATEYLQQGLFIFQQLKNRSGEASALYFIGELSESQKQTELAIVFYKQSVNVLQAIRQDIRHLPRDQQESFTQNVADPYRRLANLLLSKGRILEAQQVLELLKIQELRNYTRNARAGGELSKIELAKIEEKVFSENVSLIAFGQKIQDCQERRIQCSEAEKSQLINQRTAINTTYRQSIATLVKVLGDRTQIDKNFLEPNLEFRGAAEQILSAQPGTVLIYPLVLSDKLWLLMATEGAVFKAYEVNVTQKELSETVQDFRSQMKTCEVKTCDASDTARIKAVSQKLYAWIIPAAMQKELNAPHQHPIKHLVFAPDRVTRYIPMAALFDGNQYLIENYTVSTIVSAKLSDTTKPASLNPQNTSVLAMGLSNSLPGFNPLPNVPSELDAIVRDDKDPQGIYGGLKFLNQGFSYESLQQHLYGHQILHIATHGVFVPGRFEESYLMLGTGERLPISRIQQLDQLSRVQLVVLSACETALGGRQTSANGQQEADGLEIAGISNAFLERKVSTVLASLWQVNDASTSSLMQQFYNNLANAPQPLTKAEALRQAQLSFLSGKVTAKDALQRAGAKRETPPALERSQPTDFSHPYYWAPFILIGNSL